MNDSAEAIARDIAAIGRIGAVPSLLKIVCQNTGMGFAAVARVTDGTWTACAVEDSIAFGLQPGGQLPVQTTLCCEARAARQPVVIDHASQDPAYCSHHTPRLYNIESYISVPIVLPNGDYFGNLCAIDPRPARVSDARTVAMFVAFAELIALQLVNEQQQEQTASALQQERALAELREQFIAVLGHDLRNPLSAVGMTAELLRRRTSDPALVKMGDRLRSSTQRMLRLIDDVVDFTRGRLGPGIGVALRTDPDLAAGLQDLVAERRLGHPQRSIEDRIGPLAPVRCDPMRVQQLLSNLLGNAILYGAADQPITVEAHTDADALHLAVTNRGTPIAPVDLPRIFEPYWRHAASLPGGGLGLGLHLCAQIVKAHGGTLEVASSAAHGTRFSARLPRG